MVLEILAFIKYHQQQGNRSFTDDIVGEVYVEDYNLDGIIESVYTYYTSAFTHHKWTNVDFKDCSKWTYKAINYADGMFDPRNKNILYPEQQFDITIDKPWAKFKYDTKDGPLEGQLSIKGTIDLITKPNENTAEIIDWKTGRRLNWATGEEKTQEKLEIDPQLMIYYYAVNKLYPEIDHCIVTIYFINDGGPFSMTFSKKDLYKTEELLKKKFKHIKNTVKPELKRLGKACCVIMGKLHSKIPMPAIGRIWDGQVCSINTPMTKCNRWLTFL